MHMNFELSLQQTQKLVMTQQLQMAIKILQLPSIELNEYIEEQLEENPVLEVNPSDKDNEDNKLDWEKIAKAYDDNEYYENYDDEDESTSPLNYIANVITLKDHLLMQLHLSIKDKFETKIGEYLINNIDSAGYLRTDIKDAALHLKIGVDKVDKVLKIIQTFDPAGVGARDLKECLFIQLKQRGLLNELIETMINSYLNEIGENKYNKIAKELSISIKETQFLADIIKSLEPKPGRGFPDSSDTKYIIPDVIIEKVGKEYAVIVNDRMTPHLTINQYYRNLIKTAAKDDKTLEYVKKKLDSAAWLIKSIEQRRTTIYNVVNSIVSFQREFLDKGIKYIKPMTLKDVADDINVHESTVSRAINGKYVQTPRGLFPLKFFFTRGFDASFGDNVSSESIKKAIRDIVSSEDSKNPLSDQKITDLLKMNGINISRRTVAKYREEIGIPSTSKRKRF